MAVDHRHKDGQWSLPTGEGGRIESWEYVKHALLMDIRDELRMLNQLLRCRNFLDIPSKLTTIALNTTKRKYTRKTATTK